MDEYEVYHEEDSNEPEWLLAVFILGTFLFAAAVVAGVICLSQWRG